MPARWMVFLCLVTWLTVAICAMAWAVEKKLPHGKGSAALAGSISPDEAQRMAIERARSAIVEEGCDVQISVSTFVKNGILAADFVSSLRHGVLRWDRILKEHTVRLSSQSGGSIQQIYEVEMEGEVTCPQGATVRINGKEVGKTPFTSGDMPTGTVEVEVESGNRIGKVRAEVEPRDQKVVVVAMGSKLPPAWRNSIGMEFVLIQAGEFLMGSNNGDSDKRSVHKVRISRPFYLGKYE